MEQKFLVQFPRIIVCDIDGEGQTTYAAPERQVKLRRHVVRIIGNRRQRGIGEGWVGPDPVSAEGNSGILSFERLGMIGARSEYQLYTWVGVPKERWVGRDKIKLRSGNTAEQHPHSARSAVRKKSDIDIHGAKAPVGSGHGVLVGPITGPLEIKPG